MSDLQIDEELVFDTARRIQDTQARRDYVEQICSRDPALRGRVLELLSHHDAEGSFFERGPEGLPHTREAGQVREKPGETIGPYKLLQAIGEGGFGVVYMAEQVRPVRRKVALKIIKPGMDTKEVIARFEAERQALALMDHPNIARVLDAGETDSGRPYFVMELVKGAPLTEFCDSNTLSNRERLELFLTVCRAIQHAHQKGIIHRDLKPSNIMVTLHDNRPVPKIIDFGVSKAISQQLTERTLFTAYGQMVGTPIYMSPEQAQMSGLDIDTRSDIFSLGVILYELLTGTTPLDAERLRKTAYVEMQRLIAEEEAPRPSTRLTTLGEQQATIAQRRGTEPKKLRQFLAGDLDWIVMKALDKERSRRYETASSFAADVERFLNDDVVDARPPSAVYRLRKLARRHRGPVVVVGALLAVLCLGLVGTSVGFLKAREERDAARGAQATAISAERVALEAQRESDIARQRSDAMAEQNRRQLYASNMQLANHLSNSPNGDLKKIEELLAAWIPTDGSEDLREFSWRYQWTRLYRSAAITIMETTGAATSSTGTLITANNRGIHEWDESGTGFATKWSGDATKVTFSPDGRWAAIKLNEETQLIEIASGDSVIDIPHACCSFSARGEFLAAWTPEAQTALVWNLSGDEPVAAQPLVLPGEAKLPKGSGSVQLRDDGRSFLMREHPEYWQVTMFSDEHPPRTWDHRGQTAACAWSPNGEVMVHTNTTGMLHLRLRRDPRHKLTISSHGRFLSVLRFSPDGSRLAVGGVDGTIDLWDTSALMEFSDREQHDASPWQESSASVPETPAVGAAPLTLSELTGSLPSSVRPVLLRSIKAHLSGGVRSLAFSADGTELASYATGVSKLWDVDQAKRRYEVAEFGEDLFSGRLGLSFENSEQGVKVASIDSQYLDAVSGEIRVGDRVIEFSDDTHGELTDLSNLERFQLVLLLRGPHRSVAQLTVEDESHQRRKVALRRTKKVDPRSMRLCFSPDGTTVAIAGQKHGTSTINLATGRTQRFPEQVSNSVAISRDNLLAMDGLTDVLVWDLRKDQQLARLDARVSVDPIPPNARGGSLAFSPDGRFLVIGTGYAYNPAPKRSDLKVWRVSDLKEVGGAPVFKHDYVLSDITFTPNSAHLIATCHDGIVRIWNTDSWTLDRQIVTGSHSRSIAICSQGKTLATGGPKQIILWDFATGKKLRVLSGPTPWGLDFSPDGKTLASGSPNHNVILWDVATGMQLRTFHAHTNAVMGVAFAPDGNTLATVGNEGILRLWEASSFKEIEAHPPTLEAMFRLGRLRISEDRYEDAERILGTLLELQQKHLPARHGDIERTEAEIKKAVEAHR